MYTFGLKYMVELFFTAKSHMMLLWKWVESQRTTKASTITCKILNTFWTRQRTIIVSYSNDRFLRIFFFFVCLWQSGTCTFVG